MTARVRVGTIRYVQVEVCLETYRRERIVPVVRAGDYGLLECETETWGNLVFARGTGTASAGYASSSDARVCCKDLSSLRVCVCVCVCACGCACARVRVRACVRTGHRAGRGADASPLSSQRAHPEAVSLEQHLGDLPAQLRRYPLSEMVVARRKEVEIKSNWKVLAENFLEYYHLPAVHPELCTVSGVDEHARHQRQPTIPLRIQNLLFENG